MYKTFGSRRLLHMGLLTLGAFDMYVGPLEHTVFGI